MANKPRQNHLSNVWTKTDGKYDNKKKSKPWKKNNDKVDMFANVNMSDVNLGFRNKVNQKRDSIYRERMG